MPMKFMGKNVRPMVVRPIKNSSKYKNTAYAKTIAMSANKQLEKAELVCAVENQIKDVVTEEQPKAQVVSGSKRKNNKKKNVEDMESADKIAAMESIISNDGQQSVKIEKKEKGLYERTENSKVILTEDNKMLLND